MIGQVIFSLSILVGTGFLLFEGNQYYYFTSLAFIVSLLGFVCKFDGEVSPIGYKEETPTYHILVSKLLPAIGVSASVYSLINFGNMNGICVGTILFSLYIADSDIKFYKVERWTSILLTFILDTLLLINIIISKIKDNDMGRKIEFVCVNCEVSYSSYYKNQDFVV